MKKILIVDDDAELGSNLAGILADAGYLHERAATCREAAEKAAGTDYDVVLLDMVLPGGGGADCITELLRRNPRLKIIVITAFATIRNAVDAVRRGACDYLPKPFKIDEILTSVRRAIEEASFERHGDKKDFQAVTGALASPIKTDIIRLLAERKKAKLGEIAQGIGIEERPKVLFHLKRLDEAGIVAIDREHAYSLTMLGEIAVECRKVLEAHLFSGLK